MSEQIFINHISANKCRFCGEITEYVPHLASHDCGNRNCKNSGFYVEPETANPKINELKQRIKNMQFNPAPINRQISLLRQLREQTAKIERPHLVEYKHDQQQIARCQVCRYTNSVSDCAGEKQIKSSKARFYKEHEQCARKYSREQARLRAERRLAELSADRFWLDGDEEDIDSEFYRSEEIERHYQGVV